MANLKDEVIVAFNSVPTISKVRIPGSASDYYVKDAEGRENIAALGTNLINEMGSRQAADASLQTAINTEISRATASEAALDAKISDEASAREAAINALVGEASVAVLDVETSKVTIYGKITETAGKISEAGSVAEVYTAAKVDSEISTKVNVEKERALGIEASLSTRITNLEARGRYLSTWDAATGLPGDYPEVPTGVTEYTYEFKSGDYYILNNVPTTGTKYMPDGASISTSDGGVTWTVGKKAYEGTSTLVVGGQFIYSKSSWTYVATAKEVTWGSITGTIASQADLKAALDALVPSARTIAGVNLEDDVTKAELLSALNVEDGAQVNKIEHVQVEGTEVTITDKTVNIAGTYVKKSGDDITGSLNVLGSGNQIVFKSSDGNQKYLTVSASGLYKDISSLDITGAGVNINSTSQKVNITSTALGASEVININASQSYEVEGAVVIQGIKVPASKANEVFATTSDVNYETTQRVAAIATEAATRSNADIALQGSITALSAVVSTKSTVSIEASGTRATKITVDGSEYLVGDITAAEVDAKLTAKQDKITSTNKLNADLVADGTDNKVFTASEQTKLAGIASGAQVNVIENIKLSGVFKEVKTDDPEHPKYIDLGNIATTEAVVANVTYIDASHTLQQTKGSTTTDIHVFGALAEKDSATGTVGSQTITGIKATGTTTGSISVVLSQTSTEITSTGTVTAQGEVEIKASSSVGVLTSVESAGTVPSFTEGKIGTFVSAALSEGFYTKGTAPTYEHTGFTGGSLGAASSAVFAKEGIIASVGTSGSDAECLIFNNAGSANAVTAQGEFTAAVYGTDNFNAGSVTTIDVTKFSGGSWTQGTFNAGAMPTFNTGSAIAGISSIAFTGAPVAVSVVGHYNEASVSSATFTGAAITLDVGDITVASKDVTVQ